MSGASANLLRYVHQLVEVHRFGSLSDHQLLERFAAQRDEAAFALLVRRHGAMVLGVCRRLLGHEQDAEDAFQAVFLILARKAGAIRQTDVGGFLYRVAYRVAIRARGQDAKRLLREQRAGAPPVADPSAEVAWREVRQVVEEELQRLPEGPRSALVLCYLEGKTQEEAARLLGWSKSTLRRRLDQGRERLRQRLLRRGLAPMAALTASLFAEESAMAVPAALAGAAVRAAVSGTATPAVAVLAEAGSALVFAGKTKAATVLVLAVSLLSGAGVWLGSDFFTSPQRQQGQSLLALRAGEKTAKRETAKTIEIKGRVLDPDGKPVKGARLYSPHFRKDGIRNVQRGISDAEGRFRVELPRSDVPKDGRAPFLTAADGFGVDWVDLPDGSSSIELTLRLVKDQPIEGRILNTEGKPVADAHVKIAWIRAPANGKLDGFLNVWRRNWQLADRETPKGLYLSLDDIYKPVRTDKEGRFRITGVGCERVAMLQVQKPGIAQPLLQVITRAGFDPAPLNKAVRDQIPPQERLRPNLQRTLYGPTLDFVVLASCPIEGAVREAGSEKPLAGISVRADDGSYYSHTITDKEGRYRLDGLPRMKEIVVEALPEARSTLLPNGVRVVDRDGIQPLRGDVTLARGIVVAGRVIDKTTGKRVRSMVRFVPLADNEYFGKPGYGMYLSWRGQAPTDDEGRFRLLTLPGTGVLMAHATAAEKTHGEPSVIPYKPAELSTADRKFVKLEIPKTGDPFFYAAGNILEFPKYAHAIRYLNLVPENGSVNVDLTVDRGRTMTVRIEDADGKPLTGAMVGGATTDPASISTIREARCTIYALDGKQPRRLIFYHAERRLAGSLTVRGDEKESPVVRLARTGSVIGRALDEDGRPVAGASVLLRFEEKTADKLFRDLTRRQAPITTDKDGRFQIDGVIPQLGLMIGFRQGRVVLVYDTRPALRQVKTGETLDLGAIRVKPAQ